MPKKFFHTAGNFREHEEESKNVDWSHAIAPWINFFQNVDAIVGPDEPVIYPEHLTEELDYELELAVVLKKAGKWFSPEEAADYIGGYVIFNDITARDIQRGEMRSGVFSFCKAIDTFCPLGPWIVTPDEIADPHDLAMELRVNGEVRQESHSGRMSVTIPEILSNFSALGYSAGDVLSTGTVAGVAGFKSKEERVRLYLKPGDVIEAEIERIGVLRNPVISWQEGHGTPPPPRVRPWGEDVYDLAARRRPKLERVRALMAEHELDALVVRAPDNVLYLTNFWGMKGYDACVFPREGEPVLLYLEASADDAARTAWTADVRFVRGYADDDPRPVAGAHARRRARGGEGLRPRRPRALARHAGLRPDGRRADDVHEGAGSTPGRPPATRCRSSNAARAIKTRAGDRADPARERDLRRRDGARARRAAAAGDEGERGGCDLAGLRARRGHGLAGQGRARARLLARLVRARDQDVHGDRRPAGAGGRSRRCSRSGSAPTATGATTRSSSASASCAPTTASSRQACSASTSARSRTAGPGASFAELDRLVREGIAELGYPGQPTHPDLPRRRRAGA